MRATIMHKAQDVTIENVPDATIRARQTPLSGSPAPASAAASLALQLRSEHPGPADGP